VDGVVCSFDPETGERKTLANDLSGWAAAVLQDYETLTAHPLAHTWQKANGPLPAGKRLLPKIPFVIGGAFALENLYAADVVKGMQFRGEVAVQLRDLPDGTEVEFTPLI
jgi:hypothetical protein